MEEFKIRNYFFFFMKSNFTLFKFCYSTYFFFLFSQYLSDYFILIDLFRISWNTVFNNILIIWSMDFDNWIVEHEVMRNKSDYCTLNVFNCIDNYFISNKIIKCCATKTKSRNIVLRMSVHKNLNLYNRERYRKLTREFFLVLCKRETYYLHAC